MRLFLSLLALTVAATLRAGDAPLLTVAYGPERVRFTPADFAALPHTEIRAFDGHRKQEHRYAGVPVRVLLDRVHAPLGEKLRGTALRCVVEVKSRDGYQVVFALAEFDDAFTTRTILLADQEDGAPLPAAAGPLQIISAGDQRPTRWARQVNAIEISPVNP